MSTTRGRILAMLRETKRTVSEMARALRITETGVRLHLNALEEDGLIQQAGVVQGTRKPFHAYELTKDGEDLFPKAYGPLLAELLEVLSEKLTEDELIAACEETGRRLAAKLAPDRDRGTLERRIALALEVLTSMGGAAALSGEAGDFTISSASCPIAEAVKSSHHACQIAQSLLREITGAKVKEKCEKGLKPRCRFVFR